MGHGEGDGARRGLRHPADVGAVQRGHRALPDAAARQLLLPRLLAPLLREKSVAYRVPGLCQLDINPRVASVRHGGAGGGRADGLHDPATEARRLRPGAQGAHAAASQVSHH